MELREFDEKDFRITELFLKNLVEYNTLSDNKMLEICEKENIVDCEYPKAIKSVILKYGAARKHADIRVIVKNENTEIYLKKDYFRKKKDELIKLEVRENKKDEETDLNIKSLKQGLILSRLAIVISIIAIIVSILSLLSK